MHSENKTTGECIAVIGSVTQAMRAQRVLAEASLRVEVIRADSTVTGRGCAYGLMYPCAQDEAVRAALRGAGIRVRGGGRR